MKPRSVGDAVRLLFVGFYTLIVLGPLVWLVVTSFKTSAEIYGSPWTLPSRMQWDNYVRAWFEANIGQYLFNSIFVTAVSISLIVIIAAMAAYVLVRYPFRGSRIILVAFVSGLMVPVQIALVPLHDLLRTLGLLDSYWGLIPVYIAFSLPFTVFLLSGYFSTLPRDLEQAAIIDGCSHAQVFWRVMLPVSKPAVMTALIFNFLGIWNEFILALIILASDELKTLPLGLADLQVVMRYQVDWGALFAGLVIAIVPIFIGYIFLQEQVTEGATMGALKG